MTSRPLGTDLSTIPIAKPPPGIISNLVDPESLANSTMGIAILMLVLTAFVVIVRLFSNYHATRGLGWDDCLCVTATVLFLIYVVVVLGIRRWARHTYDIPITWITPSYLKNTFVQSIASGPMIFFAKSSLSMLYYRLFKIRKIIRYAIIFGITISFPIYFFSIPITVILCSPKVGHPWDSAIAKKCTRGAVIAFVVGITNLALDIFLLILPIPVILPLQLSVKKKIGILAIFMAGLFALAASIVSLVYRTKWWQDRDSTWNGYISVNCIMIETGVTIMCSSTSALVAFWNSHIATYVTPFYSGLCSRSRKLVTRFKFVSRASSNSQICPLGFDHSKSNLKLNNLNYVELDEHHQESAAFSGSIIRTSEIGRRVS